MNEEIINLFNELHEFYYVECYKFLWVISG